MTYCGVQPTSQVILFCVALKQLQNPPKMACCGTGGKTDSPCWNPSMAPKNAGSRCGAAAPPHPPRCLPVHIMVWCVC
jgi:hypothetical protein